MTNLMKKAGLGIALAVTTLAVAAPADAQRWRGRHYDRGGDVAAGAIVGGIVGLGIGAAIASNNNRGGYYDGGYYDRGYYGPPPRAYYRPRVIYRPYPRRGYYRGYPYRGNPYRGNPGYGYYRGY